MNSSLISRFGENNVACYLYERIKYKEDFRVCIDTDVEVYANDRKYLYTDIDVYIYPLLDEKEGIYLEVLTNGNGVVSEKSVLKSSGGIKWSFLYDKKKFDDNTEWIRGNTRYVFVVFYENEKINSNKDMISKFNIILRREKRKLKKKDIGLGVLIIPMRWNKIKEFYYEINSKDIKNLVESYRRGMCVEEIRDILL